MTRDPRSSLQAPYREPTSMSSNVALRDLYWAAGFLEGDGSFQYSGGPYVSATQVNREPLQRLKRAFGGTIATQSRKRPVTRTYGVWTLHGTKAIELMARLFPLMSPERRYQVQAVLGLYLSRPVHPAHRTHCPQGHRYDKDNTIFSKGKRSCRSCQIIRKRTRREAERRMRAAR
jgi:hypothetical protein